MIRSEGSEWSAGRIKKPTIPVREARRNAKRRARTATVPPQVPTASAKIARSAAAAPPLVLAKSARPTNEFQHAADFLAPFLDAEMHFKAELLRTGPS